MLSLMPAGVMPRVSAWLIDFAIRMAVMVVLGIITALFGTAGSGILAIGYFLITWLYPVFFEVYRQGMTPGKKAQGIYVCHDDGTPISLQSSMIRNLLRVADFLPIGFAAGALTVLFTQRSQRIGDLVAGTLVVYKQQDDIGKLYKSVYGLLATQPMTPAPEPTAAQTLPSPSHSAATAATLEQTLPTPIQSASIQVPFDPASPLFFYPIELNEQQALVAFSERLAFLSVARQQEIAISLAPLVTVKQSSPQAKKEGITAAVLQKAQMIQGAAR